MQRDKRGRFVKKAQAGLNLSPDNIISLNGRKYKVKPGANQAFALVQPNFPKMEDWLTTSEGLGYLEPIEEVANPSVNLKPLTYPKPKLEFEALDFNKVGLTFGNSDKIKYTYQNGKMIGPDGKEINAMHFYNNLDKYEHDFSKSVTTKPAETIDKKQPDTSVGMTLFDKKQPVKKQRRPIDKTKLADFLELTRAGIGASVNNKIAERALESEKPFLQDVVEIHRPVYGDYRAQIQGEQASAKLRNMASRPLTSDGALQQQMMLDAQIKGQEYIDQGNAKDDAMRRQTQEVAWQQ